MSLYILSTMIIVLVLGLLLSRRKNKLQLLDDNKYIAGLTIITSVVVLGVVVKHFVFKNEILSSDISSIESVYEEKNVKLILKTKELASINTKAIWNICEPTEEYIKIYHDRPKSYIRIMEHRIRSIINNRLLFISSRTDNINELVSRVNAKDYLDEYNIDKFKDKFLEYGLCIKQLTITNGR